jgi:hypothetical protein
MGAGTGLSIMKLLTLRDRVEAACPPCHLGLPTPCGTLSRYPAPSALREGLARLLTEAGFEVTGQAADHRQDHRLPPVQPGCREHLIVLRALHPPRSGATRGAAGRLPPLIRRCRGRTTALVRQPHHRLCATRPRPPRRPCRPLMGALDAAELTSNGPTPPPR